MVKKRPSGRSGRSGRPGRSGRSGRPGRSGHSGRSGRSGQSGEPGLNTTCAERRDLVQISHALLLSTLGKLEGPEAVEDCRRHCQTKFWAHNDWPSHRHGELDPDLTSTSLYLLDAVVKNSPAVALAKCWLARLLLNYDGGVGNVGVDWSLVPGRQTLRSVQASLRDVYMDSAMPLYRNQQWQQECRRRGLQVAGHDQRKLAATLFHELTSTGAWQRCVDEGLTHASLEKTLRVHVEFLRKVLLHDLWVSHRIGDGCDSQVVGWGARGVLRKATFPSNARDSKDDRTVLDGVHKFLKKELASPQLAPYIRRVIPGPWLKRHTQHMACELRRWRGRATGRKNSTEGRGLRQQQRAARLNRVYKKLGFKKPPGCCKKERPSFEQLQS